MPGHCHRLPCYLDAPIQTGLDGQFNLPFLALHSTSGGRHAEDLLKFLPLSVTNYEPLPIITINI